MRKYNIAIWYYIGAIFPFLSVVSCWICFYTLGHFHEDHILTISETVIPFPENRIFPVAMFVESLMLIFFYACRNSVIFKYAKEKNINISFKKFILIFSTFCVPIGLMALSIVTLKDQKAVHLSGAFFFFFSSLIYYIVSDFALVQVGMTLLMFSRIISWSILGSMVFYFSFLMFSPSWSQTLGAIFQYVTALLIFVKIILFYYDIPSQSLQVSLKNC